MTPYTNAGGKDWSELVGQTLCSCCFQQYRGKASAPTPSHTSRSRRSASALVRLWCMHSGMDGVDARCIFTSWGDGGGRLVTVRCGRAL